MLYFLSKNLFEDWPILPRLIKYVGLNFSSVMIMKYVFSFMYLFLHDSCNMLNNSIFCESIIGFLADIDTFNLTFQVIAILDRIKAEKENGFDEDDDLSESSDSPQEDRDWEGDDPDEDIIYVK